MCVIGGGLVRGWVGSLRGQQGLLHASQVEYMLLGTPTQGRARLIVDCSLVGPVTGCLSKPLGPATSRVNQHTLLLPLCVAALVVCTSVPLLFSPAQPSPPFPLPPPSPSSPHVPPTPPHRPW